MESIRLRFTYEEADWVRAMRLHFARTLKPNRDLIAGAVIAALGIAYGVAFGFQALTWVLLAGAATLLALHLAAWFVIPSWSFRREPKLRDEYDLLFGDDGIAFKTAHIDSTLSWSIYTAAVQDEASWLLYYGKATFTVIPKRVFATEEEQARFAELVRRKVSPG